VFIWIAAYLRRRRESPQAGSAFLKVTLMVAAFAVVGAAVFCSVLVVVQHYWGPDWALVTVLGLQTVIAVGASLLNRRKP
jgi:hypothetical protein